MSKKIIPAEVRTFCDKCGAEKFDGYPSKFYSGEMHLKCEDRMTGPLGESAGGTREYDLCGECMREFLDWINGTEELQ